MKKMELKLELDFADDVLTNEDVYNITRNVAEALLHEIGTKGIVPDGCETYTDEITVYGNDVVFVVSPKENMVTTL